MASVKEVSAQKIPATLLDLLASDWEEEGFQRMSVYFLKLKSSLWGFFPAVFSGDKGRVVFVSDLVLLENVWRMLEPKEAVILAKDAYVNEELGILYFVPKDQGDQSREKPHRLLTKAEFETLEENCKLFLRWSHGYVRDTHLKREEYLLDLEEQARRFDPTFVTERYCT